MSGTRIYKTWYNMKARCYNEHDSKYKFYGGKGIKVCDEWKNDFNAFYTWAMANGYTDELTIDRIDSTKDYCPKNCRWITMEENRALSQGKNLDEYLYLQGLNNKALHRGEISMKNVYPVILKKEETGYSVYIPDFEANTQGETMAEAIEQARDAMGIMGIDMEDDGKKIPVPSKLSEVKTEEGEIASLVDIDFEEYRRKHELRAVKKNCTIPSWLNYEAEKANINFSATLQNALKNALNITDR